MRVVRATRRAAASRHAVALVGSTAALVGCAALVGFPEDRHIADDADITDDGSGPPDAGTPLPEAEAGADAAANDASGSADAGGGADGDGGTFCARGGYLALGAFCDDFEGAGETPATNWLVMSDGPSFIRLETDHASVDVPGHALQIGNDAGDQRTPTVVHTMMSAISTATFAFDLYIDVLPSGENVYLAEIDLSIGGGTYKLILYVNGAAKLQQALNATPNPADDIGVSSAPVLQTWTRVNITLDAGARVVSMTFTDATNGMRQVVDNAPLASVWAPGLPTFLLGYSYSNAATAKTFDYDNVVISTPAP